jgi:hypothetical protein
MGRVARRPDAQHRISTVRAAHLSDDRRAAREAGWRTHVPVVPDGSARRAMPKTPARPPAERKRDAVARGPVRAFYYLDKDQIADLASQIGDKMRLTGVEIERASGHEAGVTTSIKSHRVLHRLGIRQPCCTGARASGVALPGRAAARRAQQAGPSRESSMASRRAGRRRMFRYAVRRNDLSLLPHAITRYAQSL